jgi:hypothetical protein
VTACPNPEPAWAPWVLAGSIACFLLGAAILVLTSRRRARFHSGSDL